MSALVSIICPVLNEADEILPFLATVRRHAADAQTVVVDGGSRDGTRELAASAADRVLVAEGGRAGQLNAGAAAADGEILWFLHVDARIPAEAVPAMREALTDPGLVGGCFRIRYPASRWVYRVGDAGSNLAVDLLGRCYGDHGIFCRREAFSRAGGFPLLPLMEDAEFYRALRRVGRTRQLRERLEVSARRYQTGGEWRVTGIFALLSTLYTLRIPPRRLAALHRRLMPRS